jgi:integration host factor subunit beta
MNKIDLIQALNDSNHLSKSEAEKIVTLFFNKIAEALAQGERVEIRGLFSFFVKKNTVDIPAGTPKTVRKLRLRGKNYLFLKWAKN